MTQTSVTSPPTQFYQWQGYSCAYDVQTPDSSEQHPPLLLIHPIGVGLSRRFWDRFARSWFAAGQKNALYNPDLLGCGESAMPHLAYKSEDWADQLYYFLQTIVRQPVILVVQGALLPVALRLAERAKPGEIRGVVLSGPPAWKVMTQATPDWKHRINWNLFDSPLGQAFYRYARRQQFLQSFSVRQLFDQAADVDRDWLSMLKAGAENPASRHAVFSFLAGFWRRNWQESIAHLQPPTLVVVGNTASSISRSGKSETPEERLQDYLNYLPQGEGMEIEGRNVLPYESTETFVQAIIPFIQQRSS